MKILHKNLQMPSITHPPTHLRPPPLSGRKEFLVSLSGNLPDYNIKGFVMVYILPNGLVITEQEWQEIRDAR